MAQLYKDRAASKSKECAMSEIQDIEKYVSQLKVVDLREGLKKRHLSYTGNKKDLAQRLAEAMLKEKQEAAAQVSLY